MPSPQDSIKKQEKKPIHPMDKKGKKMSIYSILWALISPLLATVTSVLMWSEIGYAAGAAVSIMAALIFGILAFDLFKKAKLNKEIKHYREFRKTKKKIAYNLFKYDCFSYYWKFSFLHTSIIISTLIKMKKITFSLFQFSYSLDFLVALQTEGTCLVLQSLGKEKHW